MKPLDFIKTKSGNVGIINTVKKTQGVCSASIIFLGTFEGEKIAWWKEDEFEVIDNLPDLLSKNLSNFNPNAIRPFKLQEKG